jgi:hypothetical protein
MAADALNCYTYLRDNIPKWTEDLSTLHQKMAAKLPQMETVTVKPKNDSVESIRLNQTPPATQHLSVDPLPPSTAVVPPASASPISPESPVNPAKRKRNPGSLVSFAGPGRYRTRQMAIVYYDSDIQKSFEDLVRAIGVSRNQIRKARNAARLESMASLTADFDLDDDDSSMSMSKMTPKLGLGGFRSSRSRGAAGASRGGIAGTGNRIFDEMDGILEKAQGLCERAAHQCLRDGNALAEIESTKSKFEELLELATKEIVETEARVKQLREQAQNDAQDDCEEEPAPQPIMPSAPRSSREPKSLLPTCAIEVDDDDDPDAEPIVLPPIRLTSRT